MIIKINEREQIMGLLIFTSMLIIAIFIITFIQMIRKNNSNYTYLLGAEFIGIAIMFAYIFNGNEPQNFAYFITYILSVLIPAVIFLLEKRQIFIDEIVASYLAKRKQDVNKLLEIIEKNPESYYAHKALAEIYEEKQEYEKAEDEYTRAIQIKQNDYKMYIKIANIYVKNNKKQEACDVLQSLLDAKPENLDACFLLGQIYYDDGKFKEAIKVYNQCLNYNGDNFYLYYDLGMCYTRLNDFQKAKECYSKAAILNSLKEVSTINIGQIYMIYKDYENAEKYFSETIQSDDEKISAYSYYYLAKIRLIQNNKEQAINYINLAIETYPYIFEKVKRDDLFIPILSQIKYAKDKEIKSKVDQKENEIIEYLSKTFEVVETLTNDVAETKEQKKRDERQR